MASIVSSILSVAERGLAAQDAEVVRGLEARRRIVRPLAASGSEDLAQAFGLLSRYRLVFVRCHFTGSGGGIGTADLEVRLDSGQGAAHDVLLAKLLQVGVGKDAVFSPPAGELVEPSPWTFAADDQLRVIWTNPDPGRITWGLEVGLAAAT